jgi:hypothetical protein
MKAVKVLANNSEFLALENNDFGFIRNILR